MKHCCDWFRKNAAVYKKSGKEAAKSVATVY